MKKTILIGITGGIAAYKAIEITNQLIKLGHDVEVIMTNNACQFIQPLTISTLTKKVVYTDTFERIVDGEVKHIELAKKADLFVVVPATANIIAKFAYGICDDMLTSTFLAATCKKIICPAMNTNMYNNPITQDNIEKCKKYGMHFVDPTSGMLACGDIGDGKLAELDVIIDNINYHLQDKYPLQNKKILITAGPTQEAIDPVRFITNHSSGKMGYSIAKKARLLGADVTLLSGPVSLAMPLGVKTVYFETADDLMKLIKEHLDFDYLIMSAAVGDYRAVEIAKDKIKKDGETLTMSLVKNPDILHYIGTIKQKNQLVCGFAMETHDLIENATKKLINKNCDLLVANNLATPGAGFQTDTNVVTIIKKDNTKTYDIMTKDEVATIILNEMMNIEGAK